MYKMKSCCVNGCKNQNIGPDSGVIFYNFPEEKGLKKKWIEACLKNEVVKEKNWAPNNDTVICNVHFVTGHKNANDWHPDYVPSVFRSLRRNITKSKKHLDDSDSESKVKKPRAIVKRASLATPTRNTPKNRGTPVSGVKKSIKLPVGRPKKVVLVKEETLLTTTILGRPKKVVNDDEESSSFIAKPKRINEIKKLDVVNDVAEIEDEDDEEEEELESPSKYSSHDEDFSKDEEVKLSEAGRPIRNKRKRLDDDFVEDDTTPVLKTLSVVLERTSDKKIKLSTGEITIKEEPESEPDYLLSPSSEVSYSGTRNSCKKCATLEQKLKKLEANMKSSPGVDKCRRCPVIEGKLSKVEEELDQIIDAKVSKCQKCSLIDQKCKRIENNLKKAQSDILKFQNKLTNIELNEEAFKKYKNKVKMYTGFPNFDALTLVFEHLKPHFPVDAVKVMSPFQMFIIVLMRLKLNFPFWDLTYRFGSSPNHIQSFYPQYIGILESHLSHVVLWPKANLHYRLEVLASNLRQSFGVIQENVEVNTLLISNDGKLSEDEKTVRVCAALYHISQLVSSNHSQQLMRILKSKDETDRATLLQNNIADSKEGEDSTASEEKENETKDMKSTEEIKKSASNDDDAYMNGDEEVDDSDIFFEDLTKDLKPGVNSNESLKLECKHLQKELENLNQKLTMQFRFYSGMRSFEVFNNLLGFLQSHVSHISTEKLTYFQQLHLVLIRLKLNLEVQDLSYIFKVDPDHVVYLTRLWIDAVVKKLSRYIDWPAGVEDLDGEKRLLGTVKLKYQILWNPHCAPRNKETGREKEKFDSHLLLKACAALYNIDDIEVFKDGKKESKSFQNESLNDKTNEQLEQICRDLRTELYDLRKNNMSSIANCFAEENFQNNDQMVQFYTGFPSYDMLMNVFTLIVPVTKSESRKAVSPFQQFLIFLIRMKLNLATQDLAFRFGMGHSNTHKFIQDWQILLHSQLAPHITWPDDDEDVEVFTDMLRKTYAFLRINITPRRRDHERKTESGGCYDIATLVCAGLYNIGEVSFCDQSESEFDSFDEEW